MRPLKPRLLLALLGSMMLVAACGRSELDFATGGRHGDAGLSSGGRTGAGGGEIDAGGGADRGTGGGGGVGLSVGTGGLVGVGGGGRDRGTGGARGSGGTGAAPTTDDAGTRDATSGDATSDLKTIDDAPLAADLRPVMDAAPIDAPALDLPPPSPGTLPCGVESCDTKTQSCCVSIAIGAVGARCIPVGTSCSGIPLACDEPADCAAGTCCFDVQAQQGAGSSLALGSRCSTRAACNGAGRYVVCRTNGDCERATPICCSSPVGVPVCQRTCP